MMESGVGKMCTYHGHLGNKTSVLGWGKEVRFHLYQFAFFSYH